MTVDHRIVVVGASMSGLRAAERLRAGGFTGEIVAIGDETHLPYNRPPLSKEALASEVTHEAVAFRLRPAVADVTWRLGSPVTAADLAARTVRLADGAELACDGLVVATGVRPRRLPVPGPAAGRHVVRTLEDAAALRAELRPGVRALVIGAGFIGCEVAATARGLGCRVTVVAPESAPMLRPLGAGLGTALRHRHEAEGVRFLLGRTVNRFLGDGRTAERVRGAELSDGTVVEAGVVVEAVGSASDTAWLEGNGLDLSDGVLCDNALRVEGRPRVVAVGDVARFPNPRYDDVARRVEHWSIPTDTARRAAASLLADLGHAAHDPAPFAPLPTFWSDQYDLRIQSFGAPTLGCDDIRVLEGDLGGEVVVGYHDADRLVGVVMIGLPAAASRYRTELMRAPATA
ncbi:NAD(P)/FAD-dependent oxidoreductase [Streptosporangium roseum]|uniref:Cyclic nucleotide-binding protein n=1 Tax=Streptosporangium roseum (strain ATCC 12428 / DSM 43021 / JCM 3005 / KCTC 9067 / NCIMB 10171 / NRRL 2505 / NI 9100) TaxID=479432 RepID=D2BFL4_STRRD|nr:FAD-dependent oxidoreductase [Streptosporangium roseum]ACZ90175.1 cyclic nucleotide-binding protein [Streptosporangium roseum DSM 43021]